MKRLLAYLFIVLSLSLMLNLNVNAKISTVAKYQEGYFCIWHPKYPENTTGVGNTYMPFHLFTLSAKKEFQDCKEYADYIVYKENWKLFKKLHWIYISRENRDGVVRSLVVPEKLLNRIKNEAVVLKVDKNQIAKAEPSQTQKVAKKKDYKKNLVFCINTGSPGANDVYIKQELEKNNHNKSEDICTRSQSLLIEIGFNKWKQRFKGSKTYIRNDNDSICVSPPYACDGLARVKHTGENLYKDYKTQIAKIETSVKPKKKVKVVKKEPKQEEFKYKKTAVNKSGKNEKILRLKFCKNFNNYEIKKDTIFCSYGYEWADTTGAPSDNIDYLNKHNVCFEKSINRVSLKKQQCSSEAGEFKVYYHKSSHYWFYEDNDIEVAKEEPTIKPKKKVKVVKKEPKQEEFKPKKTNQDNEAPVITIAEAITVDSQAYTLKGKVKDKSQIYLTIDGRQVDVKKGKFELDRFSIDPDVAEELKIVAIDQWNNKSEKIVKVTIDLQSTDIAKVYEQLKPNNIKVKTDKNKIAIIIGIEKYENLTNLDAKYANRDAKAFRTYATRALGIKPSNIKVLIDDKANRGNTLEAFKIWLPKIAGKGGKDIHIFFAGHGLASENGKDLYILPQDGNAKLLDDTAITRLELISLIQKVNPKSVTMFFDTCYSGQTRDERMLVASLLRPIQIISEEQDTPDNFTIFSASNYDQVSGGIEEAQHGMFSYYLMKGLEGNADENKDKKITNGELIAYLKDNVSEEAFTQNREQDPMLAGDPDKVLMSYR